MGKLSDLLPPQETLDVAPGKSVPIRALQLTEIAELFVKHQADFVSLYAESQSGNVGWSRLLATMPSLIHEVIAMGLEAPDEVASVKRLAPGVQLIALEKIWRASVPDPKALGAALKSLFAELRRLADLSEESALPTS